MRNRLKIAATIVVLALSASIGYIKGVFDGQSGMDLSLVGTADAKKVEGGPAKISPTKALSERDTYFPGTENLARNEMRVVALGTGMPSARPKQAAACFLVELGNGDKFLFDIGSGSHERIAAIGTQGHTSPEQFGKVMATVKPRMAVGYHFYNDFDIQPDVMRRVRKTYDGPLSLAVDYMVWNVTKKDIRVRMAVKDEEVWPSPPLKKKKAPDFTQAIPISEFTKSGAVALPDVVGPIYEEVNKIYGTSYEPGFK